MSSGIQERQLKPIYDALETGAHKLVVQTVNKLLKKQPSQNEDLLKSLKALALIRLFKIDEASLLCDEVLAMHPTDERTLNAMLHVLKGLARHGELVPMFEEAFRRQPTNPELGEQTFFANVRTGNWKAGQQAATKLHKTFKDDRYIFWIAMCAVLQAQDFNTEPATKPIFFKLALRHLSTMRLPSHTSPDRFHLHLSILKELSMLEEARELLSSNAGKVLARNSLAVEELRRDIFRASGEWLSEGELARERLTNGDRNWLTFLSLLDSAVRLDEPESFDSIRVGEVKSLLSGLKESDGKRERGAWLAVVELEWRLRSHKQSEEDFVQDLITYFEAFGDKACCFDDLLAYIDDLSETELETWSTFLDAKASDLSSTKAVRSAINVYKLRRRNLTAERGDISPDLEVRRAKEYLQLYGETITLGRGKGSMELHPGDDLAILAAQSLVLVWKLSGDLTCLNQAVTLLEFAIGQSKHAFRIRLHLVRLYRLLGAPSLAIKHYRLLKIKEIQNDTLSHFLLTRVLTFALSATGDLTFQTECMDASGIYETNTFDTADMIIKAFGTEKYSQIPEFIVFEDRVDNSLQRDLIKVDHLRMRFAHETLTTDLLDPELVELKFILDRAPAHHDNRDFAILPNYQPRGHSINEQTLVGGNSPGQHWLSAVLKLYIRVLQQHSDLSNELEDKLIIGEKPLNFSREETYAKTSVVDPQEQEEMTRDERRAHRFIYELSEWLQPFHDFARPTGGSIDAPRVGEASKKTFPTQSPETNGNGHIPQSETPPELRDPPTYVTAWFDESMKEFSVRLQANALPCDILHLLANIQEAYILLGLCTSRFKTNSGSRAKKLTSLLTAVRELRANASNIVKGIARDFSKIADQQSTIEARRSFTDGCIGFFEGTPIAHDFILNVAKDVTDARKAVYQGFAKGLGRVGSNLP